MNWAQLLAETARELGDPGVDVDDIQSAARRAFYEDRRSSARARRAEVRKCWDQNPDLRVCDLMERFGMYAQKVRDDLIRTGLTPEDIEARHNFLAGKPPSAEPRHAIDAYSREPWLYATSAPTPTKRYSPLGNYRQTMPPLGHMESPFKLYVGLRWMEGWMEDAA